MVQRTIALLLLSLFVVDPRSLSAQGDRTATDLLNMSLEDLMKVEVDSVYGTSGYKQKVSDAPASITVITADEIRRYGYRTLADVLRQVPGFYVSYDRDYSYLGERGFGRPGDYNSRILLQIDGHRSNDNVYDSVLLGTEFPVDIDLIERIEVIRGPNSSLYNATAFLGVINIVTKQGRDLSGVTLSEELASYGTFKSRATYGHRFDDGLQMMVSGTYYNSHGHDSLFFSAFDNPATNNGIAPNMDHDRAGQVFFDLSDRNLRLEGAFASREKQVPTAAFGTIFDDPALNTLDEGGYLDLKYDHRFGSNWGYLGRVYYDNYQYYGNYPLDYADFGGPARVLNKDAAMGEDWGAEFALSKKLGEKQTIVVGSEYRDNFKENQSNYDAQPYHQYFNSLEGTSLWGVYAQDAVQLHRTLLLDLGLRYDHYSTFGNTTNPRAALIFDPFQQSTFKLLYGQSFRAPNAYEMYYAGEGQESDLHLRPEIARTMEAVYEQGLTHEFRLVVSGYYYPVRRLISPQTDPISGDLEYVNSQSVDLKGLEFTLKRQLRSGIEAGASLSLEDARDMATHDTLTNSPHTLGQANLSVPLIKRKLFASGTLESVSRRRTLEGDYAGSYVVPNFTLFSQGVVKGWEVSTSLYNAFDRMYGDPGSIEHVEHVIFQDGRNFRLKFVYHF